MSEPEPERSPSNDWRTQLLAELHALAASRQWGRAVMAIGWVHLSFSLVSQALHMNEVYASWVMLTLWSVEVFTVVMAMRLFAGKGWLYDAPAVALIFRVWITFLILSFNAVSLNSLMGFDHQTDWFKIVWCSLASFGFATMAWLFGLRFLVPAFQMYFTGLLIYKLPSWGYLIHGASWWLALQYVGWDLVRRRAKVIGGTSLAGPGGTVG